MNICKKSELIKVNIVLPVSLHLQRVTAVRKEADGPHPKFSEVIFLL